MVRKMCGICAALFLTAGAVSWACNVPVFRYALERWAPDRYEIIVLHRGELSAADGETVKRLDDLARGDSPEPANFTALTADLASPDQVAMREFWERSGSPGLPCVVLRYPESAGKRPAVATVPLTREAVEKLVDSPVRHEIARRIKGGASAVWIFLESGDTSRDGRAYALLERETKRLASVLVLPGPVAGNEAGQPVNTAAGPGVRIDFSIVRLSRDDQAERALFDMLIHTEPDLEDYPGQPMAFPVYGRGRALYALVGDGITRKNIEAACRFLIGACSCEVKALNPGVDLLISADWEKAITESWIPKDDLPPLKSIAGLVETTADTVDAAAAPQVAGDSVATGAPADTVPAANGSGTGSGRIKRNMFVAFGVLFAATAGLTLAVVIRRGASR